MAEPKGVSYLGIELTPEEEKQILSFLKEASREELSSAGLSEELCGAVEKARPLPDIKAFTELSGVTEQVLSGLKKYVLSRKESATQAPQASEAFSGEAITEELVEGTSLWKDAWRRLLKNRMAVVCGIIFFAVVLFCISGWFIPIDPRVQNIDYGAQGPSWEHWFGTDNLGRDMMARTMEGGRISLAVGLISTMVSILVGVFYGATAGYIGGWVDGLMMRIVDIMLSLPFMFVVILILTVLPEDYKTGEASVYLLFLVLGLVQWLVMARIVRGQVLSLKKREFVEAARAIGVSTPKIIFRHLIPNTLGPIIVYTTLTIPAVMLEEAFLSFIGLGVQAPKASWGTLLSDGAKAMAVHPWLLIFPAILMSLTLFSLNFLGDGLRDALDPQLRKD